MRLLDRHIIYYILPLVIFLFAFLLRLHFFTGFILGDDAQEFPASVHILNNPPNLHDPFHQRFGAWGFHVISFKLLGVSEFSFFLPYFLLSSLFGVMGYFILIYWGYRRFHAFLAGLFIASAPFEILVGTLNANDLPFSFFLGIGLLSIIFLEKRPVIQAAIVAISLWFAFHTKFIAVYFLPGIVLYYLYHYIKNRQWKGGVSFLIVSLTFHGITGIFWKFKLGTFFPFLISHSATYPVPKDQIIPLWYVYPKMIFLGSEFGTTLFGYIPYILLALLLTKIILSFFVKDRTLIRFDKLDIILIVFYFSFFLLMNFFTTSFTFEQYYSPPRIFRYLAPLSFPMTLHLIKLLLDIDKVFVKHKFGIKSLPVAIIIILLISMNVYQTDEATKPGQIYRTQLLLVLDDIKEYSPPKILVESWLGLFIKEVYLHEEKYTNTVVPIFHIHDAKSYEKWLNENQESFPKGTMMITGLGSYMHYGCHNCGFRLERFNNDLDPRWELFKEYGTNNYLPVPEPTRLWIWRGNESYQGPIEERGYPTKRKPYPSVPGNDTTAPRLMSVLEVNTISDKRCSFIYSWDGEGNITGPRGTYNLKVKKGEFTNDSDRSIVLELHTNENIGRTAHDDSGNGNHGILDNVDWIATGRFGSATEYDGTTSYINIPDNPSLRISGTGLSISAWVLVEDDGTRRPIVRKGTNGLVNYVLLITPDNKLRFAFDNMTGSPIDSIRPVPLNRWTHVAGVYDGTTLSLYIDGVLDSRKDVSGDMIGTSTQDLTIGREIDQNIWFNGYLDDIIIWNRLLSTAEIKKVYNTGLSKGDHYIDVYCRDRSGNVGHSRQYFTIK